jgi:hypothetical protein
MKELKIVWGRKAKEQREQLNEATNPTMKDLIERAMRYMGTVKSPLYYETPEGWFTKTTWNRWGDGVELTARVDFEGGFLFIMDIKERAIYRNLSNLRIGIAGAVTAE